MADDFNLPRNNPLSAFLGVRDANHRAGLADMNSAIGALGVLARIQQQRDEAQLNPLKQQLMQAQVAAAQGNVQDAQTKRDFYSPQNLAQFQTPGNPGSASPADELGGGPAMPAQAPGMDFDKYLEQAAAQGIVNPEVYARHVAARDLAREKLQQDAILARERMQPRTPQMAPGRTRSIQMGTEEVTQELQADGTWKEIGRGPKFAKQVSGGGGGGGYATQGAFDPVKDKEALRDIAVQSLYDPNATIGYRRDTKAMAAIQRERVQLMKEAGITSEDVVAGRAGFKADTTSLNKLTPQYDAITAFEKNAVRQGDILVGLADKVDTTGVPVIERWIRAGRKATGDPDVAKFDAQLYIYRAEAAKILTNPNLTGQLTDSARHEVEDFMKPGASANQIKQTVALIKNDFDNRKQTLEEQIGSIRNRMRERVGPGAAERGGLGVAPTAPSAQPARRASDNPPPTNAKGWKLMTDANGNKAYVGPNKEIEEVR